MKLKTLKSEFLKYMVKSYSDNHHRVFMFDNFKALYPDMDNDFICDALYALKNDGFVNILSADGIAYQTTLLLDAICSVEEDTLLRKGYDLIKEIRSWI